MWYVVCQVYGDIIILLTSPYKILFLFMAKYKLLSTPLMRTCPGDVDVNSITQNLFKSSSELVTVPSGNIARQ